MRCWSRLSNQTPVFTVSCRVAGVFIPYRDESVGKAEEKTSLSQHGFLGNIQIGVAHSPGGCFRSIYSFRCCGFNLFLHRLVCAVLWRVRRNPLQNRRMDSLEVAAVHTR